MRPDSVLVASAGGALRSNGGSTCCLRTPPEPGPGGGAVADGLSSFVRLHASNPMKTNKMTDPRMAGRTYEKPTARASRPRSLGSRLRERLARQVARAARLDDDVVLDPDPAERPELADRAPVDEA